MDTLSLNASIRTCKVDSGWANKIESDRFFNPNLMMCPVWSGRDLTGRRVCPDSFWTKRAGCNSANDRITVENSLRPQYADMITLDMNGLRGDFDYDGVGPKEGFDVYDLTRSGKNTAQALNEANKYTGNFGLQFGASTYPGCSMRGYEKYSANNSQAGRAAQFANEGYKSSCNKCKSGF